MRAHLIGSIFLSFTILISCSDDKRRSDKNGKDSIVGNSVNVNSNLLNDSTGNDMIEPDNRQSGTYDKTYFEKRINPAVYQLNDTSEVLYFEDSIGGNFCSLYIKSDVDLIDSIRKPGNLKSILKDNADNPILVVNGTDVKLASRITDSEIMLPTNLGIFKRLDRTFLLVKMNLVSSMGGDYWYSLLLELDTSGRVKFQKGIETTGEIPFSQVIKEIR